MKKELMKVINILEPEIDDIVSDDKKNIIRL